MSRSRRLIPVLLACAALPSVSSGADSSAARRPRYERVDGDIETVWQRPAGEPRGIFFIAHGCNHQATDIVSDVGPDGWVLEQCASSNFGRCLGLPEETKLRQAARARGYVVVAVSGTGYNRCWDPYDDVARVDRAIRHVRVSEGLPGTAPVLATGASSGGGFMGRLAGPQGLDNLRCIAPQIMGTRGAPNRGVPTLFIHMPRDVFTAEDVQTDLEDLRGEGIPTKEIRAEPLPVSPDLLRPCLAEDAAKDAVEALSRSQVIDQLGFLKKDSRLRKWVAPVSKAIAGRSDDTLVPDESCIAELMNVAWAQHEFTAQYAGDTLDFCESFAGWSPGGGRGPGRDREL